MQQPFRLLIFLKMYMKIYK